MTYSSPLFIKQDLVFSDYYQDYLKNILITTKINVS